MNPQTINLVVKVDHNVRECDVTGEPCSLCGDTPYLSAMCVEVSAVIPGRSKPMFREEMYVCVDCGDEIAESKNQ